MAKKRKGETERGRDSAAHARRVSASCRTFCLSAFLPLSLAGAAGRRRSRRSAFTLIEIIVVVIVIAVLAGFAAPMLGERRAGAELASAARAVAQAAQLARQEAARTRAEVRLVIGGDAEDGWAVEADGEEGEPVAVRRGSTGGGTLPRGVRFAGVERAAPDAGEEPPAEEPPTPGEVVRFDAGGGATAASIALAGPSGLRAVVVHPSGRVEVVDGPAGPPAGRVDLDLDS